MSKLSYVVAALVSAVVAFGVYVKWPSKALITATSGNYTLTVFDKQCTNEKVLDVFRELGAPVDVVASLKGATVVSKDGKKYEACVAERGPAGKVENHVFVVSDDGDSGYFPVKVAKPMTQDHPGPGQSGT